MSESSNLYNFLHTIGGINNDFIKFSSIIDEMKLFKKSKLTISLERVGDLRPIVSTSFSSGLLEKLYDEYNSLDLRFSLILQDMDKWSFEAEVYWHSYNIDSTIEILEEDFWSTEEMSIRVPEVVESMKDIYCKAVEDFRKSGGKPYVEKC